MMLNTLALQGFEKTLNALLKMDEQSTLKLQQLHGRCVAITIKGTGLTFFSVPNQRGQVQLFSQWEGTPDCTISGSPFDLLRANNQSQSSQQLFAGHVQITGDTHLGQKFGQLLAGLSIDWEEALSKLVGDTLAHQVGRTVRNANHYARERQDAWQQNIAEYLTEEARLLPQAHEMAAWSRGVTAIRDDTERLIARVALLKKTSDV